MYHEFFARVSRVVKPRDFLEEIWVREIVDLSWEILRMRRLKAPLVSEGLTLRAFNLGTIGPKIDAVERIDRMIMNAEARRNAALREIERHRTAVAEALRRATDDIVDAEFEDVAQDSPQRVAQPPARKDVA